MRVAAAAVAPRQPDHPSISHLARRQHHVAHHEALLAVARPAAAAANHPLHVGLDRLIFRLRHAVSKERVLSKWAVVYIKMCVPAEVTVSKYGTIPSWRMEGHIRATDESPLAWHREPRARDSLLVCANERDLDVCPPKLLPHLWVSVLAVDPTPTASWERYNQKNPSNACGNRCAGGTRGWHVTEVS